MDESNQFSKDLKVIWVAHKHRKFPFLQDAKDQEDFVIRFIESAKTLPILVVEDDNPEFSGRGLVALIATKEDGWKIEPHVEFFPWASRKNILRTCISFFQMVRHSRKVGVCIVRSLEESMGLFNKCATYFPRNVFHKVGRIPHGDPRGDEYLYSIKGRK